jgi:hypothetical protein
MPVTNPLEDVPVLLLFAIFAAVTFIAYEIGFQVGHWYQARTPGVQEGPTGVLVGSLLALLAFLLAITMGMASDRFDTRRGLVLEEANAMGTTYLRAGYLPEPASSEIRNLLREYVPLRVAPSDRATLVANIQRSEELLEEMWSVAEAEAKVTQQGDLMSTFIESLNETIDLNESRIAAGVYARVPASILWLLVIGSVLTLGMVGYSAGLTARRDLLSAIVLIVALGAVLALVIDLDQPRQGFVQVNQQPIIDLQEQIGPPS